MNKMGLIALAAAALVACSHNGENAENDAPPKPPADVQVAKAASAAPAKAAPAAPVGCADALQPRIDMDQYMGPIGPDGARPGAAALDRLATATGDRLKQAAAKLCANGTIPADAFAKLKTLEIRNAAGADSVALYVDPEVPATLVLDYAFTEPVAPPADDIAIAVKCWFAPDADGCADRMP